MRWLLFLTGWVAVAAGALGAVLPLVPTTPFLLLALACFSRSSDRAGQWLLTAPGIGPVLQDYLQSRAVPVRAKIVALALLWPGIALAVPRVGESPVAGAALIAVALAVSAYLLYLPTSPCASTNLRT